MFPRFNRLILSFLIVIFLTVSVVLTDPGDAQLGDWALLACR